MKDSKSFALGTVTSYISMAISIFTSILMVPLLMKNLGANSYGLLITLSSIFGAMGIADLGMGQSVAKLVSQNLDEIAGNDDIKKIASTAIFTSLVIGIILIIINIIISFYIYDFMNVSNKEVQILYMILFLNFMVNFIFSAFNNILIGYKKIYLINTINILRSILIFVFTYIFLKFSNGLNILALIYLGISLLMIVIAMFVVKKIVKTNLISISYFDKMIFKNIFKPGIYFFIIQVAGLVVYNTDNIILSHFVGLAIVALYASAYKIVDMFMKLIFAVIDNLFPYISNMDGKKEYEEIKKINIFTSKFSIGIGVFLGTMYYQFSKDIIDIWLGKDNYIGNSVIIAFCVILVINASTHNSGVYINALYKHKKIAYLSIVEATLNLIFSLILVKSYGVVGVAIGTCLAAIFTSMWFVPYYCCKILDIKISYYIKNVVIRNLIAGCIFFIGLLYQKIYLQNINNLLYLILIFIMDALFFCIMYYFIVLVNEERNKVTGYIKRYLKNINISGE